MSEGYTKKTDVAMNHEHRKIPEDNRGVNFGYLGLHTQELGIWGMKARAVQISGFRRSGSKREGSRGSLGLVSIIFESIVEYLSSSTLF